MAYSYLLDLYRVLAERRAEILKTSVGLATPFTEKQFQQGRLAANDEFLMFLKNNFHSKLPRRLQNA
jgi:hypothetical protein